MLSPSADEQKIVICFRNLDMGTVVAWEGVFLYYQRLHQEETLAEDRVQK